MEEQKTLDLTALKAELDNQLIELSKTESENIRLVMSAPSFAAQKSAALQNDFSRTIEQLNAIVKENTAKEVRSMTRFSYALSGFNQTALSFEASLAKAVTVALDEANDDGK